MKKLYISLFIILGLLLAACNSESNNEHAHEDENAHEEHELEPITITQTDLTGAYELFVEFLPFVVGEKTEFITHLTRLSDYKPVLNGQLTVSLIKGSKGIRHTVDSIARPGIFLPALQPKEAGNYQLKFELIDGNKKTSFVTNNIEVYLTREDAIKTTAKESSGNEITYLKEQAWKTEFGIYKVKKSNFKEVIHTSGKILPANGDEYTVVAPFTGIVKLKRNIIPGTEVNGGESLLELSGKGLATDNISVHSNQIKTEYEKAKANFERAQILIEEKIVSEKEYIDAKTDYEQAKVAYENISFSADGSVNKVKAHQKGFIKNVKVRDGDFVKAGTPLIVIAENKRLIIQADVSQKHWHCLPDITEANFFTPYDSEPHNTKSLNGRLISYSKNASNSAWSTPVFFEISNWADLIPGTYVEIYLLSKPKSNVIAIPKSAMLEEQGNYFVFVQLNGETYEKRQIKTGISNGLEYEVLSGLSGDESIVSAGTYQVKLASMSSALPSHGHNH